MNPIDSFQRDWHTKWYRDFLEKGRESYIGHFDPNNIHLWSQMYCLEDISSFFSSIPKSSFLTVGDGYCGREGSFIHNYGHYVHASDWEPCLIKEAKDRGLVDEYSQQDLYQLSFGDGFFDFSFCKETLHHLSMPYKGLYEMFRVSKRGVIVIEPSGEKVPNCKQNDFEPTGNYVFTPKAHELLQVGLAYGYKFFAFTYTTIFYLPPGDYPADFKDRLVLEDTNKKLEDKNIIAFFFIKDEEIFNAIPNGNKFIKFKVIGTGRNW